MSHRPVPRASLVGLAAIATSLLSPAGIEAAATERSFRAEYVVSLFGLPIANADFDSTFGDRHFRIDGRLSSSGIARLFDRTTGTTSVSGVVGGNGVEPRSFRSSYVSGKKRSRTTIRFDGGTVVKATNEPQPKRGQSWVAVSRAHLQAAMDPISATLIRARSVADICDRTLRVFDGEMRADLRLTHRSTGRVQGFEGEAVTCDARFVPVSGYRKSRKQIDYLANQSRIEITFAQLADTGYYTPVDASIGTQIGTVRVTARKIEAR